ncbi:lipopolysaccharide biosynthesis protein [Aliarcobacter butzleri]|uniref:lipopolysaccharide biosynthesis protein n=1 Tax=Aliarcobacter butzleri TaxID=28197 RepID=UPI003B214A39
MLNKLKPKSEFSRNVLTLMTGTTIAQAIPIAISPILTRIYTPEDFGVLALFVAITTIFGSVANGRYELAIMLPRKDEDAINIFALGFIITAMMSFILLILAIVFNNYFTKLLGNDEISFWLYFVPLTVFLTGLWNILNYFNNRRKQYKDLRNSTIIKSIVLAAIQLSVGFLKSGVTGLISGQIISQLFANSKLLKNIIKDKFLISKISRIKMLTLLKKYKKFPIYSLPSTLADTSSQQLPYLIIPTIFSLTVSGYFSFAKKIINLPSSFISSSISQVFYQSMVNAKNERCGLEILLFKTLKKLALIAFPITLFLYFLIPYIFPFIFGQNWTISGEIAQYLSLIFFITFIVSPLSISFSVTMELEKIALWQYSYLVTTCLLFLFFMLNEYDFITFLISLVIHEYILYIIYLYMIIQTVKKHDNLNYKDIVRCVE